MGNFFLLEILMIIAYLHKVWIVGIVVWLLIMLLSMKIMKRDRLGYMVAWLIASIPVSYLEVTCEVGLHVFKLFNFCIVWLVLYLINSKLMIRKAGTWIVAFLVLQLSRNMFMDDFGKTQLIALIQEWIIVIPICLFYAHIGTRRDNQKIVKIVEQWRDIYLVMATAVAVGVLYQYVMARWSINLGFSTHFAERITYDLTFTGYSVLSILLGGSIVLAVNKLISKFDFVQFGVLILCTIACAINSSRTGLFAAAVIVATQLLLEFKEGVNVRKLMLLFGVLVIAIVSVFVLISNRKSLENMGILNSNGRAELLEEGGKLLLSNMKVLLVGLGAAHTGEHNMFLEFSLANGLIPGMMFVTFIFVLLIRTRKSSMRYLAWHLILAQQFVTDFFATTFLLPILILLLAGNIKYCSEKEDRDEEIEDIETICSKGQNMEKQILCANTLLD